ncbi:MAG: D-hexose-6-phosphate mutarotase [Kiritimatiellae bacterium]|nr:D-hexose-6-phosphate mutarotase [Kiritimatiellia bacterium]
MTIDELNARYGAPERIVFRQGHCGYPEAVLANRYGSAEVALLGANVLSYRPTGISPVIFRPAKRDYNRGESFHGGIPVCFPQFGKLAIPGMAQHGFARMMPFEVRSTQYSEEMTEIVLGLKSDAATRELWPHDFDLEVKISVSMKLNLSMTTTNTGSEPFEFTGGFHPYFVAGERDAVTVEGLDGCEYVYAVDMSNRVQQGSLAMVSSADNVYTLKPAAKHEFAIIDKSLRRAIAMVSSGNQTAIVWNPGPEGKLADFEADDWRKFVCVEPVTSWPKATQALEPGGKHSLLVAIQSVADSNS